MQHKFIRSLKLTVAAKGHLEHYLKLGQLSKALINSNGEWTARRKTLLNNCSGFTECHQFPMRNRRRKSTKLLNQQQTFAEHSQFFDRLKSQLQKSRYCAFQERMYAMLADAILCFRRDLFYSLLQAHMCPTYMSKGGIVNWETGLFKCPQALFYLAI